MGGQGEAATRMVTVRTTEAEPEAPSGDAARPRPGRQAEHPQRWDSEGAKAASVLAHESLRARRPQERTMPGDVVRHLRVPVNVSATVRRLAAEAQRGSTHASRELRAWMDVLEADVPVSTSELDTKTRSRLLQRLLSELQAEDDQEADSAPA